jgi:hypothetical protein
MSDVWILRLPQRETHCARYLNTLSLKTERRDPQLPSALGKQDLRWSLLHWERELRLTVGFITHDRQSACLLGPTRRGEIGAFVNSTIHPVQALDFGQRPQSKENGAHTPLAPSEL